MKITTNYSKQDWKNIILTSVICVLIIGMPIILFSEFVMLSYFTEYSIWINLYQNSELFTDYTKETFSFLNNTNSESISDFKLQQKSLIVLSFIAYGTFVALVLIVMIPIYLWCSYIPSRIIWVCEKLKCCPMMELIIFKDGKPCFQKKVKKIK